MAKVKNACYLLTLHELRLVFTMNSYALSADAWAMAPATSVGRIRITREMGCKSLAAQQLPRGYHDVVRPGLLDVRVEIRPERAGVRAEGVVEAGHDYPADGLA